MPHVSSGLATELPPLPTPSAVLVQLPAFPFTRDFFVFNAAASVLLEFDVFTSYDTPAGPMADVLINGVRVGQVPPNSFTQNADELATVSFPFAAQSLRFPGAFGTTGRNQLEIVPPPFDYLFVQNWRFHYWQLSRSTSLIRTTTWW
jgi:hypothetical protein